MSEEINAIRNKVVQKFCRTVLWIDDEIHLDQGLAAEGTSPLFKDKFEEFTKSGLLCHMMGFPETRPDSDPYASQAEVDEVLHSCVSLALQADIVIVDWKLGSTDSSEYAEKIVKQVVGNDKGFRFIVVLSNRGPEESTLIGFDPPFLKKDDSDELWNNNSGQFLLSLRKEDFQNANLFETICRALLNVYPDYLHLAALEIAGRIKEQVPRWLSNIPAGADWGILVERGNASERESWNTELQEGITENLLEDLSLTIQGQDLEILKPEMLTHLANKRSETLSNICVSDATLHNAFNALKQCVDASEPKKISRKHYISLSKWENNNNVKDILESVERFAEFYDIRSCRNCDVGQVCPGCIYEGLNGVSTSIAVCITAGCDCAWGNSFLFLVGKPMQTTNSTIPDYSELNEIKMKGKRTVLRFNGVSYLFKNTADSIVVKNRSEISKLTIKGVVRRDILNRLIGRYMSHTQRFGVNQPEIVRELRDE